MTAIDLRQHLHQHLQQQVDQLSLTELQLLVLLADRLLTTQNTSELTSQDIPGLPDLLNWLHHHKAAMIASGGTDAVEPTREVSNLISNLGWTSAQAAETYHRLQSFQTDWDAPGMEVYDQL
jgi:hypothetical protein